MHRTNMATMIAASLLGVAGCGRSGPATIPVEGRLELAGANIAVLAGSYIEAARVDDPSVRSSGVIEADGTFALETQRGGSIARGAPAGKYQVRILLNDDDRKSHRLAQKTLPTRYLAFQTSGLVIDVPTDDAITLRVSARSGARAQAAGR
ncbi:MAG TPA: hypothetical protein VHR72_01780 [Gemmataceae bacterium]|nr:hypothetical protein [Gemmataceae bacterium]